MNGDVVLGLITAIGMVGAIMVAAVYVGRQFGYLEQQLIDVQRQLIRIDRDIGRIWKFIGGGTREE